MPIFWHLGNYIYQAIGQHSIACNSQKCCEEIHKKWGFFNDYRTVDYELLIERLILRQTGTRNSHFFVFYFAPEIL